MGSDNNQLCVRGAFDQRLRWWLGYDGGGDGDVGERLSCRGQGFVEGVLLGVQVGDCRQVWWRSGGAGVHRDEWCGEQVRVLERHAGGFGAVGVFVDTEDHGPPIR